MKKPKVLVIVGPTASGKTSLSIELAKCFNGEVISADSRQVYRGLDIGTGKVTKEEMDGVPHHLLDVADPKTVYTASDFVRDGRKVIEEILERGNLPIVVGGSFFYVDALLGRVAFPDVEPDETLRGELDEKSTDELYEILNTRDPSRAKNIDKDNRRRLIRAIEISAKLGTVPLPHADPLYDPLILGIDIPREKLHENIHARLVARMEAGMLEEVKRLHESGLSYDRLESLGLEYRYLARHLRGELSYCEMLDVLETKIRQFAKRQMTWLKRDKEIVWVGASNLESIDVQIRNFLSRASMVE